MDTMDLIHIITREGEPRGCFLFYIFRCMTHTSRVPLSLKPILYMYITHTSHVALPLEPTVTECRVRTTHILPMINQRVSRGHVGTKRVLHEKVPLPRLRK